MAPQFVRANIRAMAGYTPGEQPSIGERVVKLNTNENPFPPSEKVMQAIAQIEPELLRRYPNPTADVFRNAAAKVFGVERDMIIAGNGSDEILSIAVRTFLSPGDTLAFPEPTYSLYPILAELSEVQHATVPWEKDYGLPAEALLASNAKAIFVVNPNAPTGPLNFNYHLPLASLAVQLQKHWVFKSAWNYYNYTEHSDPGPALPRDFRGNVYTLSMRYIM